MNDLPDIDLHALQLLRLVADARSFTAAAKVAGLSQSALSRQVQSVEHQLGVKVLERTTRKVSLTEAGAILLRETESIPNILTGAVRRIEEEVLRARKEIRIGISPELALAHLPGIFHAHQRSEQDVKLVVSQATEKKLLERTQVNGLDLAILTEPDEIPQTVRVTHEMEDHFCIVAPAGCELAAPDLSASQVKEWATGQSWLFPSVGTSSRRLINLWTAKQKWKVTPSMELENFDLIIQLVALGMGASIVPRRALSGFPRKHLLQKVMMPHALSRRLLAIVPRFSRVPDHVEAFVKRLLFS